MLRGDPGGRDRWGRSSRGLPHNQHKPTSGGRGYERQGIFTRRWRLQRVLQDYMSVCRAAIICSHPDVNDRSVRFLGDPEAWSLPTRGFLEKTGHVHPAVRQWWEGARRGWCGAERTEGSGRGERAWAGVALKHYPKIISFCSPVHFFLGMIQFLFFFFFPQRVFLPNDTSHRIRLQSQSIGTNLHSPIPRWPGGRRGGRELGRGLYTLQEK